ncbi:hypothetical protein, partial [Pseudomonas sp. F1002]|uniref:hypothetical protein n=1 Tax=Pseudomonas sp. F1002 TaxID=2738821 RepID=UPI001C4359E8
AFCLLLRFSKVSRCKSGTNSSPDRNNGYAHTTNEQKKAPRPNDGTGLKIGWMRPTKGAL